MIQDRKYLKDISFLMDLTKRRNKEIYIKIISLDFSTENEIGEIEGLVINGSLSTDGSSSVRRSGSLSIFCNTKLYEKDALARDINYYKHFFGISKKIDIEIGLSNDFNNKYPDLVWFQMGRYILTNATFANNVNGGVIININIGDKMNLLNGYCGGTISSTVEVDKISDIDAEGKIYERRASIYEMLLEMINHLGGEELGRILISDLETTTKTGLRIKSDNAKKYYLDKDGENIQIKEFIEGESPQGVETFSAGDFIGYRSIDYTYPTKDYFTLNSGDSVVTGLDKIKSTLGNYEYFYDLNGNFRWQEIKNYKNTSKATMDLRNLENKNYLIDRDNGNAFYDFEDSGIIISYNNSPQYSNLKNDFIIWGTRTVGEGSEKRTFPIQYHLAIDDKPEVPQEFNEDNIYLIIEDENFETGEIKYKMPILYETIFQLPSIGREDSIYFVKETQQIYKYDPTGEQYIKIFTKDIKNPTENNKIFYDTYNQLYKDTENINIEKDSEFNTIKEKYLEMQTLAQDITNFTNGMKESLSITIDSKELSFITKEIEKQLENYSSSCNQLESLLNTYVNGSYLDEKGNNIFYSTENNLPKIVLLLDRIKNARFYRGSKDIIKNLENFDDNILKSYRTNWEKQLKDYKESLEKYYGLFVDYENAKTTIEKNKIKDEANKIFYFSPTDVSELLDQLNKDFYIENPTIGKYEQLIAQRERVFNNILTKIGILTDTSENNFILNEDYKIGDTLYSSKSFRNYIDNYLDGLFDNKLLDIFIRLFTEQFNVLINIYYLSLQQSWDNSSLLIELESFQNSLKKSIFITTLFPLSGISHLLNDTIDVLYIYNSKEDFPTDISENKNIGFLDGGNGDVYIPSKKAGYYAATGISSVRYIFPQDWRTMLFLQNLDTYSSENNIYGVELQSRWGELFDLIPYIDEKEEKHYKDGYIVYTDQMKENVYSKPDLLNYWLDFIDSKAMDFNELKISNIGRRTLVQKNDKVNCIYAPQIPDYIILEDSEENQKMIQELEERGQKYIIANKDFLDQCDTNGLTLYSAFDSISNSLYSYLGYNNTINITCLPMFFLEPNIRIKLRDESSDIYGDYVIKSFSISLNNLSTMNITCTKVIDSI